jgi:antitoxin component YwqK of YwqJK toxin-antitoxin module
MEIEVIKKYWPNGILGSECSREKNFWHGPQIYYYDNGNIRYKLYRKNGIQFGLEQNWNIDKTTKELTQTKNNELHGIDIEFKY